MCAASRRGSRCWRKTLALYGEAGPKRALCAGIGTKHQIISCTDSKAVDISADIFHDEHIGGCEFQQSDAVLAGVSRYDVVPGALDMTSKDAPQHGIMLDNQDG